MAFRIRPAVILVALVTLPCFIGAARLLAQGPCNPCYNTNGSSFICCDSGVCGPIVKGAPTCSTPGPIPTKQPTNRDASTGNSTGGYQYFPAGSAGCYMFPNAQNPCYTADGSVFTCCPGSCGPLADNDSSTCQGGPPTLNSSSTPTPAPPRATAAGSSAKPMVNGGCAAGSNPCYVADGSYGYCCATSCALNGGPIPLCSGDPEAGPKIPTDITPAPKLTPSPTTPKPITPAPTPTTPNGPIAPNFTPPLVPTSGSHRVLNPNIGIAPMHGTPVPFTNKVLMIDRTDVGPTQLTLAPNVSAYAGEYDLDTNTIRAISVPSNTWCSAGSYLANGTIVNNGGGDGSGGFAANAGVRTFDDGGNLVQATTTKVTRWYPSAVTLQDGRVMMVGGQDLTASYANQASYEYFPPDGQAAHPLPFLAQANVAEAYLYPFLHVIPDGRVFVFAAQSSVLLNYNTGATTTLPDLPGNLRQYPLSGASVLLPLDYTNAFKPQIMVCGGGDASNAYTTASSTCGTINPSASNPAWTISMSPSPRVMGYLVLLLDGTILYTGGGKTGYASYFSSSSPNLCPSIYDPSYDTWQDVQSCSNIARLYHSVAFLIADGRVLIHGSNPRSDYDFSDPSANVTQPSVEAFSPWYMSVNRPTITTIPSSGTLGGAFTLTVSVGSGSVDPTKIRVALINPSFATHTVSMSQRYVRLELAAARGNDLTANLPANSAVLPPGPYLCTVLYQGVPSPAKWFKVQA